MSGTCAGCLPCTPPTTTGGGRIGRCGCGRRAQHRRFPAGHGRSGVDRSWAGSSTSTSPHRGFASAANRAYLTRGGGHYIHAEKLRPHQHRGHRRARPAGPLPHRLRQPAGHGGRGRTRRRRGRRRRAPHPAVRDLPQPRTGRPRPAGPGEPGRRPSAAAHRGLRHLDPRRRNELVGSLKTKPGLRRYLRRTKAGLLRVDQGAIAHWRSSAAARNDQLVARHPEAFADHAADFWRT